MPELTKERLTEIEERAAKATGETWELREVAHGATPWSKRRVYRVEIIAPQYAYGKRTHVRDIARIVDYCDWTDHPANADFIAHARTDIPDLIAALRELQAENERLRQDAAKAIGAGSVGRYQSVGESWQGRNTDMSIELGKIITDNQERDAIHVAVAPVEAQGRIPCGGAVAWAEGRENEAVVSVPWGDPRTLGIADPFMVGLIKDGERFWMLLTPNTVTGMRHHWQHPAFNDMVPDEPTRSEVLAAMRKVAATYISDDESYDVEVALEIKEGWVDDDDIWALARGFDMHDDPGDFWGPVEEALGRPVPERFREQVQFTCSC